jgi:hypothetical protein
VTPLEAARYLAADYCPTDEMDGCQYCGESGTPDTQWKIVHKPDCPWLQMPAIVRVLEAAAENTTMWVVLHDDDDETPYAYFTSREKAQAWLDANEDAPDLSIDEWHLNLEPGSS